MGFGGILRQSTAVDVLIGPFVDSADGNSEEDGLTISQGDVLLSKNGQPVAQKNDNTACAHDADGFYNCELDATDTNTVGQLTLYVHETGALCVRHDYQVIEEAVYDALYAASATGNTAAVVTIASDLVIIASDLLQVYSDTTIIYSDTSIIYSDTTAIHSDTTAMHTQTTAIVSDTTAIHSDTTAMHTQTTTIASDLVIIASDLLQVYSDTTIIYSDTTIIYSDTTLITAGVNVTSISGDTTAADRLEALMDGIIIAQVNGGVPTTTAFIADGFTEATNDHFNGRLITFISGALIGQQTDITDYTGATQTFTVTALTEAPADDDFFVVH